MKRRPVVSSPVLRQAARAPSPLPAGLSVPMGHVYEGPRPAPLPPPPKPLLTGAGVAEDYEAFTWTGEWETLNSFEVSTFVTSKRRRGVDVYVSTTATAIPPSGLLTIKVFAISAQGARTLVATGRWGRWGVETAVSVSVGEPQRVVACRALAERFEIVAGYLTSTGTPPTGGDNTVSITTIASDHLDDAPSPDIGSIVLASSAQLSTLNELIVVPELVGISAVNGAAAARYLHVHFANPNIVGRAPNLVFPMGDVAGKGFHDFNIRKRIPNTPGNGGHMTIVVSSTPLVTAVANDCFFTAQIR